MKHSALFVVNPFSGDLPHKDEIVRSICDQLPSYDIRIWKTTGEQDKEKLSKVLGEVSWELILVGGGDGTIKMVAEAMEGKDCCLVPVPFGSANGLATCLGIESWEDSLKSLASGTRKPMDLLEVNGQVCLHLCDFGFNADLIRKFEEGHERGMPAYLKNSLASFFELKPYRFEVNTGAKKEWVSAKMLVIANGTKYGTGATINPHGRMDDGLFEIIALNPEGMQEWVELTYGLVKKELDGLDFVQTWSRSSVRLLNADDAPFHIDGEPVAGAESVEVRIGKRKICLYYLDS
jgi:diacylglycerol kinase family enzyme